MIAATLIFDYSWFLVLKFEIYSLNILTLLLNVTSVHRGQLVGYNHMLFISVFWKIRGKNFEEKWISFKKLVVKVCFYELCTVKMSQIVAL